jgi:carboxyl-terminal processing protease
VFGGCGITPDIFVPEDTIDMTSYYKQASMSGLILQFAFTYTDKNRQKLNAFESMPKLADYLHRQNTVEQFATYADNHGLKRRNLMIQRSYRLLERYINSRIIYNIMDEEAWHEYINIDDKVIKNAMDVFQKGESFPRKPSKKLVQSNICDDKARYRLIQPFDQLRAHHAKILT